MMSMSADSRTRPGADIDRAEAKSPPLVPDGAGFSVLFPESVHREEMEAVPDYFRDLNIDQIVEGIVTGREEYNLRPFLHAPLHDVEAIRYRHGVFRDCRDAQIAKAMEAFAADMRLVRKNLAQIKKLSERLQEQAWLLDTTSLYCDACVRLRDALRDAHVQSDALKAFRAYLSHYTQSTSFATMKRDAAAIHQDLFALRYKVLINGSTFTVQRYEGEIDYSADVLDTFERFKQAQAKDHHSGKFQEWPNMNHVEAKILEFVAHLFPEPFARLDAFCSRYATFRDPTVRRFDREIQFFLGYLAYIQDLPQQAFCEPEIATSDKEVSARDAFDLALAVKLAKDKTSVVRNDFELRGKERILIVSGPNQGGKTTFSRMFGQVHYLAAMGCPVPSTEARLYLFDQLFTHFEREESIDTLSGKLQDDLNRVHDILMRATPRSVVILNEIFTSTSLADALFLSKRVIAKILKMDMLAVWVTFVDELSRIGPETVSMVSDVVDNDPSQRTFRIKRKVADGKSYAMTLAQKHGLTYERVLERVNE